MPGLESASPAIVLRFVGGADIASRLIEWFGGNIGFSHVDAVLPLGFADSGCLLGARADRVVGKPSGVQIRPDGYAAFRKVREVRIPCTPEQQRRFYTLLLGQVGKPYSKANIAGLAFGVSVHPRDAWICDALQAWCLVATGVLPRALFAFIDRLTPNSLYLIALTVAHLKRGIIR